MQTYTAAELERETGFNRRTIAYYVQIRLLPKVGRRGSRTRYPKLFRDRLLFIRKVREAERTGQLQPVSLRATIWDKIFEQVPVRADFAGGGWAAPREPGNLGCKIDAPAFAGASTGGNRGSMGLSGAGRRRGGVALRGGRAHPFLARRRRRRVAPGPRRARPLAGKPPIGRPAQLRCSLARLGCLHTCEPWDPELATGPGIGAEGCAGGTAGNGGPPPESVLHRGPLASNRGFSRYHACSPGGDRRGRASAGKSPPAACES